MNKHLVKAVQMIGSREAFCNRSSSCDKYSCDAANECILSHKMR